MVKLNAQKLGSGLLSHSMEISTGFESIKETNGCSLLTSPLGINPINVAISMAKTTTQ
jgi:hypothetical protein